MRKGAVLAVAVLLTTFLSAASSPEAFPGLGGKARLTTAVTPGVTRSTIRIGLHAPLTGAWPTPAESVEKAKDLFFRWMEHRGDRIDGRDVTVVLKNDQYNPSRAVSMCKEMVERDRVFMLVGIEGGNQMQACARYAESVGVPYVSPGSVERGLRRADVVFTTSMTYRAEGKLLADLFVTELGAKEERNGIVYFDSPSWIEGREGFRVAMEQAGATVDYDRGVSSAAGSAEARLVVQEMQLAGIDNVFFLAAPTWFIQVLQRANELSFRPTWTGISATGRHEEILKTTCPAGPTLDEARFLSSSPALPDSDRFDPSFRRALDGLEPGTEADEVMWKLWNLERIVAKMLDRAGPDPNRRRFIRRVERADRIATPASPPLSYTPRDHFGARSTYLVRADCDTERWFTVGGPRSDF